jgi:type I restriction enzyme S subunit
MKKGWKTEPLGELCDIRNGSTPSKGNAAFWDGGTIPWFTIDDMREQGREISSTRQRITKSALSETSVKLLPEDSVLLCCTASVGEFAITRIPLTTNQQFNGLVVKNRNQLDPNFLFHYASTLKDELLGLSGKTTIDFIPISRLRDVAVPVPPLAEQQRIVGLLDEAFEGLATAKANAEKNLQNARALFESHLQSVFTQRGPGWVEKRLGDLSRINYGYTESASFDKVGPHFLRITDIQDNGVDWDTVPYCPIDASDLSKYKLADGDIVFARTGATTGKSYLVSNPPESVFASYLIRVQLSDKELLPQFVNLFFQTHSYWDTIRAGVSGSAQGGFNATKLGALVIPFPKSSKEQMSVVAKLDKLTVETQRLARLYERKHAALDALKKSLLHQAFSGAL